MDLELVENLNGGDFVKKTNDLSVIHGFENMPYIALFGGNVKASTQPQMANDEQDFSWWGNAIISEDPSLQFNSQTERILQQIALNNYGRIRIEEAVKKDLEFMQPFANVTVEVSILGNDRVLIAIRIVRPNNLQQKEFIYIWDATNRELIDKTVKTTTGGSSPGYKIFDYTFDD